MLVGTQDQQQDIGNENGEQGLLIQAGVGINEEVIKVKGLYQLAKAVGEQVHLVALPQHPRNLHGFDAGRKQVERSHRRHLRPQLISDVIDRLLNTAPSIQVVVKGQAHLLRIHAKEDVQARCLDVCVDDSNTFPLLDKTVRKIGGEVGFACPPSIGVNRNDRRHYSRCPFLLLA